MTRARRPITADDLWAMKRFGAPSPSPDGRWVCVTVTDYSLETNEPTSRLWLLSTDGRVRRRLTQGPKDADPQWSPDGRWIAFTARRARRDGRTDDEAQIHLIAADGGEATRVTDYATGVTALRWFPDSRRLAFVSWVFADAGGPKAQARRMKADRDDPVKAHVVERNAYRYWDHWFPRGRTPHLHVATLRGGDASGEPLADAAVVDLFEGTDFRFLPEEIDATLYDISPDGREVAFTFDFERDPEAPSFTDVVLMDVRKRRWHVPTANDGRADGTPRYSPDGRWIAMSSIDFARAHNEQARLALIRRTDHAVVPLTFAWDRGVGGAAVWASDGRSLFFVAETEIAQPIWVAEIPRHDDAAPAERPPVEWLRGPRHGGVATDLARSADGSTFVYARSTLQSPPKLYACDADGTGERPIERFNDARMERLDIADTTSIVVEGFDREPVQMWVVTPPGFESGADGTPSGDAARPPKRGKKVRRRPLMHMIHGGPHTCLNDAWHWRWNLAVFAAAGYVVAAVNYHGSTGWGQAFLGSIDGDLGRRELVDVEAGTDFLLGTGAIDPERVVATGGSYGGYLVALMNGRVARGRYAAYVCHAGCFDWVAMMATDGYFWLRQELGGFPWQDEAGVLAQSPHRYADAFDTPTLVIHGELDYRVPYTQGLAYYNTLRAKKVPSRLVLFPDENHWVLKPRNSLLWYREFFEWLQRHAGPRGRQARSAGRALRHGG